MKKQKIQATVAAIIENQKDEILLEKRNVNPFKNFWCLPGGHIEFGENALKAVKREIREEVGLKINPIFLFYQDEIIKKLNWHAIVLVFYAKIKKQKVRIERKEVKEIIWIKPKKALKLKLAFKHKEIIKQFLELKRCLKECF
ncbi:MAG: DNA mismatch repair protein MutT [Candidatus Aenigmarchaeota archaeon ex4484_224]|nr:MAG: DNA mismatch repair protein MutT [Candidatus Aenigmarchaeota archaeon ex4484_224]